MDLQPDRRQFIAASLASGTAMSLVSPTDRLWGQSGEQKSRGQEAGVAPEVGRLHIKPRYHRWHVEPGVEWLESNTAAATLDWTIPLPQVALVLVDVWDHHYLKDTEARTEQVIDEKLLPLLTACRAAGLSVIHAPSPAQAMQHPNWVALRNKVPAEAQPSVPHDSWPPPEFRSKNGAYQAYSRPVEARQPELQQLSATRQLHPKIQPLRGEAVIATGAELHLHCKQQGILFLLFAGFNTNACILVRDYGTLEMSRRGYEVILVRDCTTGMESPESQPTLAQTKGATLFLEMFGQYSIASDEIIAGLPQQ